MNAPLTAQQELDKVLAAEQERRENGQAPDLLLAVQRAKWLEKLAQYEAALDACDEADELIGGSAHAAIGELGALRGQVYVFIGRYTDALEELDRTEALLDRHGLPLSPELSLARANVLFRMGLHSEFLLAISRTEDLLREQGLPGSPEFFSARAQAYSALGRLDEALECYQEADRISLEQGSLLLHKVPNNMALLFMELGKYDDALSMFLEAEQRVKAQGIAVNPMLKSNLAHLYLSTGRPADAIAYLDEAEQLMREQHRPIHPILILNRGRALCALGQTDAGLEQFAESERQYKALDITLDWQLPLFRALALHGSGRMNEAIEEIYSTILQFGELKKKPPAFILETLQDWMSPKPELLVAQQIASQPEAAQPVPDNEKRHDVFICYRRDPGHTHSMLLQAHMEMNGKSVFRDQDGLSSGRFEDALLEAIRHSRHMVILLTPGFFDRCCSDDTDVVRREIATALHYGTHIIPVKLEGFSWPASAVLPEEISDICGINAMSHSSEFYTAFIDKLLKWMGE